MSDIRHRTVETNGIRMHVAEAGTGPLVVLCHGFPESWYSWRHQLAALAAAGYHAVAPDMRGYGQTDAVRALLAAGARADLHDDRGKAALDIARAGNFPETVKLLEATAKL